MLPQTLAEASKGLAQWRLVTPLWPSVDAEVKSLYGAESQLPAISEVVSEGRRFFGLGTAYMWEVFPTFRRGISTPFSW